MDEQFPDGFDCDGLLPQRRQHLGRGPHRAVPGSPSNPGVDATIDGDRGHHRPEDQLLGDGQPRRASRTSSTPSAASRSTSAQPIPVGGLGSDVTGYIEPGVRKLNGHDTLWFARAREGSDDYSRMARQKCVMNAMLHQISPQTARAQLREDRQGQLGDDLHQRPAPARSTASSTWRSRPRARRSPRSRWCRRWSTPRDPDIDADPGEGRSRRSTAPRARRPAAGPERAADAEPTPADRRLGGRCARVRRRPADDPARRAADRPDAPPPRRVTGGSVGTLSRRVRRQRRPTTSAAAC